MKKQTNWITIPDDTIHTPVSEKKEAKKSGEKPVKNKIFWGISFAILVVASFALLAPTQFGELLKGSLFDTSGVSQNNMEIDLTPKQNDTSKIDEMMKANTDKTADATTSTDNTAETTPSTTPADETIVTPQEEAVDISVTPVNTDTTPAVTPVGQNTSPEVVSAEECKTDLSCFAAHLKDCSPAKATADEKNYTVELEITGAQETNCVFTAKAVIKDKTSDMQCKIAKGDYKSDDINKIFTSKDELNKTCTGTESLAAYLDSLVAQASADDEQAKLIADLKSQIDQLQQQRQDDIKTMQDITAAVQDQTTHSSAPETVPASVTSTATIGQSQTVPPVFRANPYKVTVTPEQMLQQNSAQGYQYAQQNTGYSQSAYQQSYAQTQQNQQTAQSYQVANSGTTPQSGPSEVLLLTFVLTFLGLVGWKFVRTVIG